jgi:peptidase E
MADRHIVALGGGGISDADSPLARYLFDLTGASRPRVCYVPTATGDAAVWVAHFYRTLPSSRFEPTDLRLFDRTSADLREQLLGADAVYVGGGNTANMLAIWRVHGVDTILREAWEGGVVLFGGSAGGLCWFEGGITDSFGPGLAPLRDGLGFLSGSFCPHYDGEELRRPTYQRLVAEGFPPGYAADDAAGIHFVGTELAEAISSVEGSGVYRVARGEDGAAVETPVPCRTLTEPQVSGSA